MIIDKQEFFILKNAANRYFAKHPEYVGKQVENVEKAQRFGSPIVAAEEASNQLWGRGSSYKVIKVTITEEEL
jgi:hypothetical protein